MVQWSCAAGMKTTCNSSKYFFQIPPTSHEPRVRFIHVGRNVVLCGTTYSSIYSKRNVGTGYRLTVKVRIFPTNYERFHVLVIAVLRSREGVKHFMLTFLFPIDISVERVTWWKPFPNPSNTTST